MIAEKEIIKELEAASGRHFIVDVFGDAVHMMACSLWSPFAPDRKAVEDDFAATRKKYDDDEYGHICHAFGIVIEQLELKREELLGHVLEEIGAAAKCNGQFLTPNHLAKLMARIGGIPEGHKEGEIIRIADPACGASVLLIAEGEDLLQSGVRQADVFIEAGDIDKRACDISFVELSLLWYAAKVEHMDALAMKRYSEPRYTAGYFLHGMPMRLRAASYMPESDELEKCASEAVPGSSREMDESGYMVQGTFDL